MTVHELIKHLQVLPQNKKVVLRHDDHTDWTYFTDLTIDLVDEDEYYNEDKDQDEDVVIINCKFWD